MLINKQEVIRRLNQLPIGYLELDNIIKELDSQVDLLISSAFLRAKEKGRPLDPKDIGKREPAQTYVCPWCGLNCRSPLALKTHLRINHPNLED